MVFLLRYYIPLQFKSSTFGPESMSIWYLLFKSIGTNLRWLPLLSLCVADDLFPTGCSTHIPSEMELLILLFFPIPWFGLLVTLFNGFTSGWISINGSSTQVVLDFSSFLPELSEDVRELSMEQIVPLMCSLSMSFRVGVPVSVNSENEELGQPLLTIETNWEISALASSTPTAEELYPERVSCAFFSTDCKYFPWASIRSWRCLCTWK